jgi:hypothetical protein
VARCSCCPSPVSSTTFQGQPDGGLGGQSFEKRRDLAHYQKKVFDFWFGNGQSATPSQEQLDAGSWLWRQDGEATPALPKDYEQKSSLCLRRCAQYPVRHTRGEGAPEDGRHHQGDGTVTWASGRIGNIGSYYYMPAAARRSAVDQRVPSGARRTAAQRRDRRPAAQSAGGARRRGGAAGDLRRRPADAGKR